MGPPGLQGPSGLPGDPGDRVSERWGCHMATVQHMALKLMFSSN